MQWLYGYRDREGFKGYEGDMITLIILDTIVIAGIIASIMDIVGEKMTDLVEWIIDKIEKRRKHKWHGGDTQNTGTGKPS